MSIPSTLDGNFCSIWFHIVSQALCLLLSLINRCRSGLPRQFAKQQLSKRRSSSWEQLLSGQRQCLALFSLGHQQKKTRYGNSIQYISEFVYAICVYFHNIHKCVLEIDIWCFHQSLSILLCENSLSLSLELTYLAILAGQ